MQRDETKIRGNPSRLLPSKKVVQTLTQEETCRKRGEFVADSLADDLNVFFDRMVNIERIKVGNWQTIDTLISEETLLFAKYLRNERKDWNPRIPSILVL